MFRRARLTALAALAAAGLGLVGLAVPAAAATSTTVRVDETSLGHGWTVVADRGGSGTFVNGPATPPAGVGSFQLTVPDGAKVNLTTTTVAGQPLSSVDAVQYSTYRSSTSTMPANVVPALNMEICSGGTTAAGCQGYTTLVWEPVYAYGTQANNNDPIVNDTWQTWNALGATSGSYTGGWWSTRAINGVCAHDCFVSLTEIQAANPNAVIASYGVNVGHGPAGTFAGNADALTLGVNGGTTVYDFEHAVTLTGKDQCKDGGWMTSTNPVYRNQGGCVSSFASNGKAHHED
jgi:hypothetical protein